MHKHQFQFSSNWPNDPVCKHTCRTTQDSCSGMASDDVHAVRGTRYVPAGFFTSAQLARIPELLVRNPAKSFEQDATPHDDGPLHPGDDVALTPGQLNDFELCVTGRFDPDEGDEDYAIDLRCWGGDQVLTVASFETQPRLSTVLERAREHWLRYHSSLRH